MDIVEAITPWGTRYAMLPPARGEEPAPTLVVLASDAAASLTTESY